MQLFENRFSESGQEQAEKRAREVGIRKAIGSVRGQLITQFLGESLLVIAIAFTFALLLAQLALPFFNDVADKKWPFYGPILTSGPPDLALVC